MNEQINYLKTQFLIYISKNTMSLQADENPTE